MKMDCQLLICRAQVDTSIWGVVPRNPIQVTNAFSNDPADRPYQDVGFDGLTDSAEEQTEDGLPGCIGSEFWHGLKSLPGCFK